MTVIEPGRVCVITRGADAGKEAVVKQVIDKNFVIIVGERVKERRANISHLAPLPRKAAQIPAGPAPAAPKARAAPGEPKTVEKIIRKFKKEQQAEEQQAA